MSKTDMQESQQESQGIAIGTQGNQGGNVSNGTKGSHRSKEGPEERQIPNQDRSSASNQESTDRAYSDE